MACQGLPRVLLLPMSEALRRQREPGTSGARLGGLELDDEPASSYTGARWFHFWQLRIYVVDELARLGEPVAANQAKNVRGSRPGYNSRNPGGDSYRARHGSLGSGQVVTVTATREDGQRQALDELASVSGPSWLTEEGLSPRPTVERQRQPDPERVTNLRCVRAELRSREQYRCRALRPPSGEPHAGAGYIVRVLTCANDVG